MCIIITKTLKRYIYIYICFSNFAFEFRKLPTKFNYGYHQGVGLGGEGMKGQIFVLLHITGFFFLSIY